MKRGFLRLCIFDSLVTSPMYTFIHLCFFHWSKKLIPKEINFRQDFFHMAQKMHFVRICFRERVVRNSFEKIYFRAKILAKFFYFHLCFCIFQNSKVSRGFIFTNEPASSFFLRGIISTNIAVPEVPENKSSRKLIL